MNLISKYNNKFSLADGIVIKDFVVYVFDHFMPIDKENSFIVIEGETLTLRDDGHYNYYYDKNNNKITGFLSINACKYIKPVDTINTRKAFARQADRFKLPVNRFEDEYRYFIETGKERFVDD